MFILKDWIFFISNARLIFPIPSSSPRLTALVSFSSYVLSCWKLNKNATELDWSADQQMAVTENHRHGRLWLVIQRWTHRELQITHRLTINTTTGRQRPCESSSQPSIVMASDVHASRRRPVELTDVSMSKCIGGVSIPSPWPQKEDEKTIQSGVVAR